MQHCSRPDDEWAWCLIVAELLSSMPYDSLPAIDSAVVLSTLQRVISEASYRNHPA